MLDEATRNDSEATLMRLLEAQASHSMPALELIRNATTEGVPEMDAREALLSLMLTDSVELTHDRRVRLETAVAA